MRSLFDVNVVIALLDPEHAFHRQAHAFWERSRKWASCPLVENGVLRVLTGANYPRASAYSNQTVFELFRAMVYNSDHKFWADDISLLDETIFNLDRVHGPKQLTDVYLLGLACKYAGSLVTFDRKISLDAVRNAGSENLVVI